LSSTKAKLLVHFGHFLLKWDANLTLVFKFPNANLIFNAEKNQKC
jgi:hypothetical protein